MSSENVEAAYRLVESLNRRDLDAALAVLDEDVEFVPIFQSLRGRGHENVRAWWDEVFGAVPDFKMEIVGFREYDDTRRTSAGYGTRVGKRYAFRRSRLGRGPWTKWEVRVVE